MRPILTFAVVLSALGCGGTAPAPKPPPAEAPPPVKKLLLMEQGSAKPSTAASPLLAVLRDELSRSMQELKQKADPPPYFVSYQISDATEATLVAVNGALGASEEGRNRFLDVEVRVGSHELDNSHPGEGGFFPMGAGPSRLPVEDNADAIRVALWRATDSSYKDASEQFLRAKAGKTVRVEDEDKSPDFSKETPTKFMGPLASMPFDKSLWEKRLRDYSSLFKKHPEIHQSQVVLELKTVNQFLVTTEGTEVQSGRTHVRLMFGAATTADDGMELSRSEVFDAATPDGLPGDDTIRSSIGTVIKDLVALRASPLADTFEGPAILEGEPAGVFFHEIFGHRVEGHRQRQEEEGQTFAKKIGQDVMPPFVNIYDDPTVYKVNGIELIGHYLFDDEGIAAQRASLVEQGKLKGFLLSRTPARGFIHSNGHGRRQGGFPLVARQGNLFIDPIQVLTPDQLKARLIEEVQKQKKPYGLRFRKVEGGFTMTGRFMPQAFKVTPVVVFKVYPDGKEELIRGVDLEGTPLTSLSEILAAGNDYAVFNGICGAESGEVPVSAISPSLLVRQVEVTRKEKGTDRPPILPAPESKQGGAQ